LVASSKSIGRCLRCSVVSGQYVHLKLQALISSMNGSKIVFLTRRAVRALANAAEDGSVPRDLLDPAREIGAAVPRAAPLALFPLPRPDAVRNGPYSGEFRNHARANGRKPHEFRSRLP